MSTPVVQVRTLPGGHVALLLPRSDDGGESLSVVMPWRVALRLALRMLPACGYLAQLEGLSEAQFDVVCDAETDQVAAEIRGAR